MPSPTELTSAQPTWARFVPLFVFALGLVMFVPWLGAAPLAGTEGHRVITALAMRDTGDWLTPRIFWEVYLRKPTGFYWLLAIADSIGPSNPWTWRLPSALAMCLTAAWVAWMSSRWFTPGEPTSVGSDNSNDSTSSNNSTNSNNSIGSDSSSTEQSSNITNPHAWIIPASGGIATLGMVALWAQTRSAEIDAVNKFASIVAASCILHLMVKNPANTLRWCVLLAVSLGSVLLLKLHGGMSVVGGAIVGGAIASRWKGLKSWPMWLGVLGGFALFFAWVIPVWLANQSDDTTGVREAGVNLFNIARWGDALVAQGELWLFGLPWSVGVFIVWSWIKNQPKTEQVNATHLRMVLAVLITIAIGHLLLLINGIANPRYGYVLLPMWGFVVAWVARQWIMQELSHAMREAIGWVMAATAIGLPVAATLLAIMQLNAQGFSVAMISVAILAGISTVFAWIVWAKRKQSMGFAMVAVGVLLLSLPMGLYFAQQRAEKSGYQGAMALRDAVGQGAEVSADAMVRDMPEVLWYAEVSVAYRRATFDQGELPTGWVVLTDKEWKKRQSELSDAHVVMLPTREGRESALVWID